jgi:serine/threonine protein kinase
MFKPNQIIKNGDVEYIIKNELGQNELGESYIVNSQIYDSVTKYPIITEHTLKIVNLTKVYQMGLDPETVINELLYVRQLGKSPICDKYISCVYDTFILNINDTRLLIIISDYITGYTLQDIISEQKVPFISEKLLEMMSDITAAVAYIHTNNLVHQNLSPNNIIYDTKHEHFRLMDFSYSCSIDIACKGKAGKVNYMSPELITAVEPISFEMRKMHDIWSIGVIFFELANLYSGIEFINFKNKDPNTIAFQIVNDPINPSNGNYQPINSIINVILNKNMLERPDATQIGILLQLARPVCMLNGKTSNRIQTLAELQSLGINVPKNIGDYELCQIVNEQLSHCIIGKNKYARKELLLLANLLDINEPEKIKSKLLCSTIQEEIKNKQLNVSNIITNKLLTAIEIIIKTEIYDNGVDLSKLYRSADDLYNTAKNLNLINKDLVEKRIQDLLVRSKMYEKTGNLAFANVDTKIIEKLRTRF